MTDREQVAKLMTKLGLTEDEALELIASDKAIDRGEKLFELTAEQKAVAKSMTITSDPIKKHAPKATRNRPENDEKNAIIAVLADFLSNFPQSDYENVTVINKSRLISFNIGDNSYELSLIQKRKPKK